MFDEFGDDSTDYSGYGNLSNVDLDTTDYSGYGNLSNTDPDTTDYSGYANLTNDELVKLAQDTATNGSTPPTGLVNALKKAFGDGKGGWNLAKLATVGAGLAAASKSNNMTQQAGYQGKIPKYTAVREAPGIGQLLSGNVSYKRDDGTIVNPNTTSGATGRSTALGDVKFTPGISNKSLFDQAKEYKRLSDAGYNDTQIRSAAENAFGGMADTDWKNLQKVPTFSEGIAGKSLDDQKAEYKNLTSQGLSDAQIRSAADATFGKQGDEYWKGLTGLAAGGELKKDGFVIPADVVSHYGNGSSEAGLQLLIKHLGATPIKGEGDGMSDSIPATIDGKQEARVANDEAYIPPEMVKRLGGGDSKKGAKKLYAMMDQIRHARTGSKEQGKQIDPNEFMPGGSVQSYVGGGTTLPAGTTGTESSLSNWAGDYVTDMLAKGQALSEAPYEPYKGALTAGPSALQTQAFNQASGWSAPGSIATAAQTAGDIATKAQGMSYSPTTSSFDKSQADAYMNPYLKAALDPQLEEARRQSQITQLGNAAKMTQAGGFGGSRQAILDAENQRNLGTNLSNITGQGYNTAYNNAMSQFNADQTRKMQEAQFGANYGMEGLRTGLSAATAQGNLGATQGGLELQGIQQLAGLGGTQRGIESEKIAADKAAFEEARLNPYKMVQFQQSLLSGLPLSAQTYNQAPTSNLQQFSQGATTVDKLLQTLELK